MLKASGAEEKGTAARGRGRMMVIAALSPTDCARIGLVLRYITDMHISIRGRFLKAFIDGEMVSTIESSFSVDVGRRGVLNDELKPLLTNCEFIEVKYLSF